MEIKDLKKTSARDSLRMHQDVKARILSDFSSISEYFHYCVDRDYKLNNGKIVKRKENKAK